MPNAMGFDPHPPPLVLPGGWGEVWRAVELAVVPQLPLTLTNAVIVTAVLCRDLFPERAARASVRNLALTSGAANLLLAPSAPCRCATARAASLPTTVSARVPGWRRSSSAPRFWGWRWAPRPARPPCSRPSPPALW